MTVNPKATGGLQRSEPTALTPEAAETLARAYTATYRGPHGDAPGVDAAVTGPVDRTAAGEVMSPAVVAAHYRLGWRRPVGDTRVAVYADDDRA